MVLYTAAGLNIIGLILVSWAARSTFAQTTISDCSSFRQWVTASASYNTTVTSPNYPSDYNNSLECTWLIEVDPYLPSLGYGYVVKVTFNDFNLEKSYKCRDDVLKFYDGMSSVSGLLGGYCSTVHPEVIYSTGKYLYVKFLADGYFTSKGFSFSFSAVKAEEATGICRSTDGSNKVHSLSGTSGTFFTTDYPVPYPDDARCIWTISVPTGKRVKLTFEDFYLDPTYLTCESNTDSRDYVQMRDGQVSESKELALYCGYHTSATIKDVYSTGRYMWVKFHSRSDGWQTSRGFKARFDAVDLSPSSKVKQTCFLGNIYNNNLTLTGSSGTLQSPTDKDSSLGWYPPDSSCDWLITVPDGKVVKLSFDRSFEMEPTYGSTCTEDYVEILDGKNNSESKGRFCGYTTPEDIHSSGRYMWVRFRSDSSKSYYDGFKATFAAVDKPSSDTLVIAIIVSVAVFIVLVCCIVCIVKYKKKKPSGAAGATMAMPMSTTTTPASYPTQPAGVIQYPPPPPPQAPYQPLANPYPPPHVGYAPVPTNPLAGYAPVPPVPPPGYPYPMQPPPPYPGEEALPQYPPPGQSYAWQQSAPVKASAPPQSP